jgi:hypothetical protein
MSWKKRAQRPGLMTMALAILDDVAEQAKAEGDAESAYRLRLAKTLVQLVIGIRGDSKEVRLWEGCDHVSPEAILAEEER